MALRGREQVNNKQPPAEQYTLEAILSEYKSEAYVRNERRLTKDELERQAEAILAEMRDSVETQLVGRDGAESQPEAGAEAEQSDRPAEAPQESAPEEPPGEPEDEVRLWQAGGEAEPAEPSPPRLDAVRELEPEEQAEPETPDAPEEAAETEAPETPEASEEQAEQAEPADQEETEAAAEPLFFENALLDDAGETEDYRRDAAHAAAQRKRVRRERRKKRAGAGEPSEPAPPPRELTAAEASRLLASGIGSLRRRTFFAILTALLMTALVLAEGRGVVMPGFLSGSARMVAALVLAQLLVMLLGADVLLKGVGDLLMLEPGVETLAALANLAALADALLIFTGQVRGVGLPFCSAAALSLAFTMLGARMGRSAYRETFRAMKAAKVPTVVTAEAELAAEGVVLNKKLGSPRGFLDKCVQPDLARQSYRKLAPLCLLASLVLSMLASVFTDAPAFFHCLAAMLAAAAPLTAAQVFHRPFLHIARRLSGCGAALAGWEGCTEAAGAIGIIVRDLDVFPENTVRMNGMKVLSGSSVDKVVSYTGSLILASGSGLTRIFRELLRQYAVNSYEVEEFSCYEGGGIGAYINQDQILVGSGAFMNLMGIRVPSSVDVAGAVYTAVNKELSGVFIINYTPLDIVQNALVTLLRSGVTPIYAIRDFNVNPAVLKSRFKISIEELRFLSYEDRYRLSADNESGAKPAALMSREGLGHFVEIARSARRLKKAVRGGLTMTVLGTALSLLVVFFACAMGAYGSASVDNLSLFMLLWAMATTLVADTAGAR